MADRLRLGIVGAGIMGAKYARTAAHGTSRYRAEVVAVCDRDVSRSAALALEVGARSYAELDAMLAEGGLDAVYLAVPDAVHKGPALACIAAGLPLLVEKPLATSVADAEEIVKAARAAGTLVEVNFANRWNPTFIQARRVVDAGQIGDLVGVNARLSNAHKVPESMPWAGSTSTGWFLLSHVLDITYWLSGQHARSVYARGVKGTLEAKGIDTFDLIHCLVTYSAGASGLYEAAWILPNGLPSPVDFKYQVIGTRGMVAIDTSNQMIVIADDQQTRQPGVLDWADTRLHSFLDKVETRTVDEELLLAGLENSRLLVALHESIASGTVVELPLWTGEA